MRSVILWDVMDTLVYDPFRVEMPAFFGLSLAEFLKLKHPDSWREFERGKTSEGEYFERLFRDGRAFDRSAFRACVHGAYRWVDGMEALLRSLHERRTEMHSLSNYPVWFEAIEERLRLSRYLKWSFVSTKTGILKPSPEAFLGAAHALGLKMDSCLLIDDNAANCAAAESLGMPAIRFSGAEALRQELRRRGLLGEAAVSV